MNYKVEKFDHGPVYFLKKTQSDSITSSLEAVINIEEVKEHANYKLNIIVCKNYKTHSISVHGSYINLHSIMQIAINILDENPNIYQNIKKTD